MPSTVNLGWKKWSCWPNSASIKAGSALEEATCGGECPRLLCRLASAGEERVVYQDWLKDCLENPLPECTRRKRS